MLSLSGLMPALEILISVLLFSQVILPQSKVSASVDFDNNDVPNAVELDSSGSTSANLSECSGELTEEERAEFIQFALENHYSSIQDIDVNPVSVDFGSIEVGSTSAPETITIKNKGCQPL